MESLSWIFSYYAEIGLLLWFLGLIGLILNFNNLLLSIISLELALYGLNFYLVVISNFLDDATGQIAALIVLTIAGAESAIALALIMSYFKMFKEILLDV